MQSFAVFCTKAALPYTSLAAALASFRKNADFRIDIKVRNVFCLSRPSRTTRTRAVPL